MLLTAGAFGKQRQPFQLGSGLAFQGARVVRE